MAEQPTKKQQWLARMAEYLRPTPQGNAVLTLKLNINKAGHGYLSYVREDGRAGSESQPVNNVDEACDAFRTLWEQAVAQSQQTNPEQ